MTAIPIGSGRHAGPSPDADVDLAQQVKNLVHGELSCFLEDVEFRLAQSRQVEARTMAALARRGGGNVVPVDFTRGQVFAEDLNLMRHQITGYTVTANSPAAGSIAWTSLHIVYNGVDYVCANGNSANKYIWFVKPATGTAATLASGNTKPVLAPADSLIFVNNAGTPVSVLETSLSPVVADGAIGTTELAAGAVTDAKVGTGINGAKLLASSVGNTQLGTGISGAKLLASSVGATQLADAAIGPSKLNTLQHILY